MRLQELNNAVSRAGFGVEADVLDRACRRIQHATRGFLNRLKWHKVFLKFRAFRTLGAAAIRLHTQVEGPGFLNILVSAYKAALRREQQERRAKAKKEAARKAKANKTRLFGYRGKQSSFNPQKAADSTGSTRQQTPMSGKKDMIVEEKPGEEGEKEREEVDDPHLIIEES